MQNKGKYGEDFSKAPTQNAGESNQAYAARLKDWQRRRSMSGSASGTRKPAAAPAQKKKASPSGGFVDKILRGLNGES